MSQTGAEPPWVFLSYSRDDQPHAREVIAALEAAGVTVWWDGLLQGGARYNDITEHKLENAYAVIVLWSETSTHSHWVHDEAMRGRDRGVLLPASIDGSEPPLGFRQFQWIALGAPGGKLNQQGLETLVQSVERLHPGLAGETPPAPRQKVTEAAAGPAGAGFRINRRAAIGGGIALAAIASGTLAWRSGLFGGEHSNSVAVMPFNRIGESSDQAYFSDGLAAEIRARLARNPLLKVAAEASSKSFRDSNATARDIADQLKVAYLLEGSVAREGERVKVRVDLIDGGDGTVVVPLDYDQSIDSIFDIQDAIAAKVVSELAAQFDGSDPAATIGGTHSVAAYEAYLRGRELYDLGSDEASDREALAKFEEAIRIDPQYAAAHAGKSRSLALIGNLYTGPAEREGIYSRAVDAAREAIRIAPDFADGHSNLGFAIAMGQLDMKSAREPYQRSYELGAGDADILSRYAIFRSRIGDSSSAQSAISQAASLDPLNARVFRLKGDIEYAAGRPTEALASFRQAKAIQDSISSYHWRVGLAQLELGDNQAARDSFAQDNFVVWQHTGGAIAEHRLGNLAAAQDHLAQLKSEYGNKSSYQYAQVHAQWGEIDKALAALEDAWRLKDSGLSQLFHDPLLAPIRETREYQALAKRIGFV
ncbi:TIR domain-containing protein [Parerythrobacter aestuarii]|uniref:TIR domain-containing protein n=1 Tax=Parerythrobacter aestuarii TaxID=3020909 RepID=UPI0024DE9F62|nr:TIR domain-containing protein [Parerythrobacter aestuarii]